MCNLKFINFKNSDFFFFLKLNIRPYTEYFLNTVHKYFEIIIFTNQNYVDANQVKAF